MSFLLSSRLTSPATRSIMQRPAWRALTLAVALVGCVAAISPAQADPCETLASQHEHRPTNLGSGWALPIVANPGHLPAEVAFTALGATDTAFRFRTDGAVEVLFADRPSLTIRTLDGDTTPTLDAWQAIDPVVHGQRWITADGTFTPEAFGAVSGHLDQLSVRHGASSRLLRTTYGGDWSTLGLQVSDFNGIGRRAADGSLEVYSGSRYVRLYPAAHGSGDAAVHIPFVLDGDILRLDPQGTEGTSTDAPLDVVWEVADFFHGYDAVSASNGAVQALSTTVGATASGGRDILVLELNADGTPRFTTVLASHGDDRAAAVSRSSSGELYVAGFQGASGLALDGKGWHQAGPFVARLDRDGARVAGRYLGADGFAVPHDLALDGEDRVLISGRMEGLSKHPATSLAMEITLPTAVDAAAPQVEFGVLELDSELQPSGRQSRVRGDDLGIRLQVRPACSGVLYVGPPAAAAQGGCTSNLVTDTYTAANPAPGDFFDGRVNAGSPDDPWGFHALRWKHETQTAHAYTPPNVAPFLVVGNNDHTQLDNLEANSSVFATEPAGSWLLNTTMGAEETAIGAALYMDFWTSPSYANLKLAGEAVPRPAALMSVEFCVQAIGNNASVVDYCAATAAQQGIFTPRYPIDEIDRFCDLQWTGGMINIRHVDIDHWTGGSQFTQGTRLPQPTFQSAVTGAGTLHQWYIADPPDDAEAADGLVQEAAQRLSGQVVRSVPTQTLIVDEGGHLQVMDEGNGWIPSLEVRSREP